MRSLFFKSNLMIKNNINIFQDSITMTTNNAFVFKTASNRPFVETRH